MGDLQASAMHNAVHTLTKVAVIIAAKNSRVHSPGIWCCQPAITQALSMLQVLGFMARRGHRFAVMSTYHSTWVLKTDGTGSVWVSDAIEYAAPTVNLEVSVTQVCASSISSAILLISCLLCNARTIASQQVS